jgi:hypothetical protein
MYWLVKPDEVQAALKPVLKVLSADANAGPLPAAKSSSGLESSTEKIADDRAFSAVSASTDTGTLVLSADTTGAEIKSSQ